MHNAPSFSWRYLYLDWLFIAGFGSDPAVCICDPWLWTFNLDREEARLLGLVNDIVEAHKKIVGSSETIGTCINVLNSSFGLQLPTW